MIVYKITNTITGKVYIGQTVKKLDRRWKAHVYKTYKQEGSDHIHNAIRKYGHEVFTQEILVTCQTKWSMNMWERKHIFEHKSYDYSYGYNMTFGGDSVPLTPEGCAKISKANRGRKQTPEQIEKRIAPLRGRKLSDERRQQISDSHKTRSPVSDETRRKQSESHCQRYEENPQLKIDAGNRAKGRKTSEETKRKQSDVKKGKSNGPFSDEACRNMSEARLRFFQENPEAKVAMSERLKGKKQSPEQIKKSADARRGKKYGPHKNPKSEAVKKRMSDAAFVRHAREKLEKQQQDLLRTHQPKINLLLGREPINKVLK